MRLVIGVHAPEAQAAEKKYITTLENRKLLPHVRLAREAAPLDRGGRAVRADEEHRMRPRAPEFFQGDFDGRHTNIAEPVLD